MPQFTDTDHFLDRMAEAEAQARQGWANMCQNYTKIDEVASTAVLRDPAAERLELVAKLMWYERILEAAFASCTPDQVVLWWLLRARRMTRNQAVRSGLCPYSRRFMQGDRCQARLDELDQLLLDELSRRRLLSYARPTKEDPTDDEAT